MFLGKVEIKIWSKSGLCHCSTLTWQTQGDAHCLALTNTSSNNRVCYFELNLNNHRFSLGWRNILQLPKTYIPQLNSLIINKSGKKNPCCKKRPFHVLSFCWITSTPLDAVKAPIVRSDTSLHSYWKVNHLYMREKSTHWKKTDPCSDEKNKTEFWEHKQVKLFCPCRGRKNWNSKQIKINTVTDNRSGRLFPKEYKTT